MKRSKAVVLVLLVLMFICSLVALTACTNSAHAHNYSSSWDKDNFSHWQSCFGCNEIRYKANHDWNSGKIVTYPTETTEGEKIFTCNICGYTKSESIAILVHEHSFATDWSSDDSHHWKSAICEHKNEKSLYGEHSWDAGTITKNPTETDVGEITYTCVICGKSKSQILDKNEHIHTFDTRYSYDNQDHWFDSTCGHENVISSKSPHNYNDNYICYDCGFDNSAEMTLDTPTITKIEYDIVYWEPVENADTYTIQVNDNYVCELRGTSCSLAEVKWNDRSINTYGPVSVKVMANRTDKYLKSDWSQADDSYFYVPTNTSNPSLGTLINYSIGFGYNLIDDDYLDITQCSGNSVFDIGKLLTIGDYTSRPASSGGGYAYSYSSVDEFISKTKVSFDYGQEAGCVLLGSMKMQINADISFNYKEYSYNNKYVYQYDVVYKDHLITNFGDINLLIYCLSETFLKDIRRESDATKNMSDNQLVEHIFKEYGTHAILGITTGGSFFAEYTISTNKKEIAAGVKAGFGVSSGGQAIDQIVASNFNLSIDIQEEIEKNTETTKTDFRTHYYGGKGGAATSPISVDSALSKWSDSMNEDVATSIKFTKDGAISIVSLLRSIDYSLANKLDAYITEKADETYKTLFNQFSKPATLPVDMQTENGDNMLVIDLSSFQQVGNLDNVYYPTVEDNVFIIYPTMFAKTVECIKIVGAYNTCNNMISSFSIRLSDEWISNTNSNWDKNIDIILENVGFYTANENGFIDITEIENKAKVNIICIGNNAISAHDGNGQSAIILEELTITSLGESASLTVTGGKGADGDDGEKVGDGQHGNRGKDGLHGGTAIEANSLSVNNINLHLTGGEGGIGGDGSNGNSALGFSARGGDGGKGGDGGYALILNKTTDLVIINAKVIITGGVGGNGGKGGNGGEYNFGTSRGKGGNGGHGGNGGYALCFYYCNGDINELGITLYGGNGGKGGMYGINRKKDGLEGDMGIDGAKGNPFYYVNAN